MRSSAGVRSAAVPGSRSAETRKTGASLAGAAGRSPPMGTPPAYARASRSGAEHRSAGYDQPPKKRGWMRLPLVPKVSRRCMASKIASREFSSAHTTARPPGLSSTFDGCVASDRMKAGDESAMPVWPMRP